MRRTLVGIRTTGRMRVMHGGRGREEGACICMEKGGVSGSDDIGCRSGVSEGMVLMDHPFFVSVNFQDSLWRGNQVDVWGHVVHMVVVAHPAPDER